MGMLLAPGLTKEMMNAGMRSTSNNLTKSFQPKVQPNINMNKPNISVNGNAGGPNWIGSAVSASADVVNGLISNGRSTTGGQVLDGLGTAAAAAPPPYGPILSGVLKTAGGVVNNLWGATENKENIAALNNQIAAGQNFLADANSFDSLSQIINSQSGVLGFDKGYLGKEGAFNHSISGMYEDKKREAEETNGLIARSIDNNLENLKAQQFQNLMLDDKVNITALGGQLDTFGMNYSLPLDSVETGGTHEENPYGGVQVGVDSNGVPNFVEEGETIFNGYVFSQRLKVPEEFRVKYGLGKQNKDLTFADASKKMSKEADESPFDPISKRGQEALLSALSVEQEKVRAEQAKKKGIESIQPNQMESMFAYGGSIYGNKFDGKDNLTDSQKAYIAAMNQVALVPARTQVATYPGMPNYSIPNGGLSGLPTPDGAYSSWDNFIGYDSNAKTYTKGYLSDDFRNYYNSLSDADYNRYFNKNTMPNYFKTNGQLATRDLGWELAHDKDKTMKDGKSGGLSDYHKAMGEVYKAYLMSKALTDGKGNPISVLSDKFNLQADPKDLLKTAQTDLKKRTITSSPSGASTGNGVLPTKDNWLRYMPVVGSALGLAHGLFTKPDYGNADMVMAAANSAGAYKPVSFSPLGDYATYRPLDRQYGINQLNAQAGAAQRNIFNTSGGNRGQAMAGLLAAGYNTNMGIGNLLRQAEESNQNQRLQIANFNRGTNQYNSQTALQADMANQNAAMQAAGRRAEGVYKAAAMREAIDNNRANGIAANFSNLFTSLGNIGMDKINRYDRDWYMKYVADLGKTPGLKA